MNPRLNLCKEKHRIDGEERMVIDRPGKTGEIR